MHIETQQPVVVGLGELLWDCFENSKRPGGAPANVAFQANQLACQGVVCTRVGPDAEGDELVSFLNEQGIETEFVQRDQQLPTGRVTVDTSKPGSPEYVIHEDVAWDAIAFDDATQELMQSAAAVCFGTLAQRFRTSRETIHRCLEATTAECLRVYDVNLRQHWYAAQWIESSLAKSTILKLGHGEVSVLAKLLHVPDEHASFADSIRDRFGVQLVCITRAEHGCLLLAESETVDIPGEPVDVVDAVGAGDAFTAALIFARLQAWPLEHAGRFANAVGGLVTTRQGAMPQLGDEFAELIESYRPTE